MGRTSTKQNQEMMDKANAIFKDLERFGLVIETQLYQEIKAKHLGRK
jgi:hypothetical protein